MRLSSVTVLLSLVTVLLSLRGSVLPQNVTVLLSPSGRKVTVRLRFLSLRSSSQKVTVLLSSSGRNVTVLLFPTQKISVQSIEYSGSCWKHYILWKILIHQGEFLLTGLHRQVIFLSEIALTWVIPIYSHCKYEKSSLTKLTPACFKKELSECIYLLFTFFTHLHWYIHHN